MGDKATFLVPVARLMPYANPFAHRFAWKTCSDAIARVYPSDIEAALADNRLEARGDTDNHAERVAYFVKYLDENPIQIDVGEPSQGRAAPRWIIRDGNHRLMAAVFSKRVSINANIIGELDYAVNLFGIETNES